MELAVGLVTFHSRHSAFFNDLDFPKCKEPWVKIHTYYIQSNQVSVDGIRGRRLNGPAQITHTLIYAAGFLKARDRKTKVLRPEIATGLLVAASVTGNGYFTKGATEPILQCSGDTQKTGDFETLRCTTPKSMQ